MEVSRTAPEKKVEIKENIVAVITKSDGTKQYIKEEYKEPSAWRYIWKVIILFGTIFAVGLAVGLVIR